jgi:MFS transporter, DHA1 family, multidrug resistance protein
MLLQIHGFNPGIGGLPFLGNIVGQLFAGVYMILIAPSYNRKLAANHNIPVPEWRMPHAIFGGALFGIGILWFGEVLLVACGICCR